MIKEHHHHHRHFCFKRAKGIALALRLILILVLVSRFFAGSLQDSHGTTTTVKSLSPPFPSSTIRIANTTRSSTLKTVQIRKQDDDGASKELQGRRVTRSITVDIVTFESRSDAFFQTTLSSWSDYAKQQGYGHVHATQPLMKPLRFNKFACLLYVMNELQQEQLIVDNNKAIDQWILWVDSDIYMVNKDMDIVKSVLEEYAHEGTQFIVSEDCGNPTYPINNGIFWIRTSAFSKTFLERMVHDGFSIFQNVDLPYGGTDQAVMTWLLMDELKLIPKPTKNNNKNKSQHAQAESKQRRIFPQVSIAPARAFNSFCRPKKVYSEDFQNKGHIWQPGDPIMHIVGMPVKDRQKVLDVVLANIPKNNNNNSSSTMSTSIRGNRNYNPCLDYSLFA